MPGQNPVFAVLFSRLSRQRLHLVLCQINAMEPAAMPNVRSMKRAPYRSPNPERQSWPPPRHPTRSIPSHPTKPRPIPAPSNSQCRSCPTPHPPKAPQTVEIQSIRGADLTRYPRVFEGFVSRRGLNPARSALHHQLARPPLSLSLALQPQRVASRQQRTDQPSGRGDKLSHQ